MATFLFQILVLQRVLQAYTVTCERIFDSPPCVFLPPSQVTNGERSLDKESDRQLILAVIDTSALEHLSLDKTNLLKVRQKSEISIDGREMDLARNTNIDDSSSRVLFAGVGSGH